MLSEQLLKSSSNLGALVQACCPTMKRHDGTCTVKFIPLFFQLLARVDYYSLSLLVLRQIGTITEHLVIVCGWYQELRFVPLWCYIAWLTCRRKQVRVQMTRLSVMVRHLGKVEQCTFIQFISSRDSRCMSAVSLHFKRNQRSQFIVV